MAQRCFFLKLFHEICSKISNLVDIDITNLKLISVTLKTFKRLSFDLHFSEVSSPDCIPEVSYILAYTACEKCPDVEFFLVHIFSPNMWEYGPEKTPYLDTFT